MKEIFIILVVAQIVLLLLKGTFIGRILFMMFKVAREMLKMDYMILCKTFRGLNKLTKSIHKTYKKRSTKRNHQEQTKKVVNGSNSDNVIQFTKSKSTKNKL